MDKKNYLQMSITTVVEMLENININFDKLVIHDGFAINLNLDRALAPKSIFDDKMIKVPYIVRDFRLLRILSGYAKMEINFTELEISAGDILLVSKGSYFQILELSDDIRGEILVVDPEVFQESLTYVNNITLAHPNQDEWDRISHLLSVIYLFASSDTFRSDVLWPLVKALMNEIIHLSSYVSTLPTNQELLFNRFIDELKTERVGKQSVRYYADKLCITPQYLSRIVSQVSGKTVSEWICKAVLLDARIMLKDTQKTISEIAEQLNFPNDSFFCRFFKRETGQTPTQYRRNQSLIQ